MNPITYLRQVTEELSKVSWPTRKEALNMTFVVIGVSAVVGIYVGGLDSLFTVILDYILKR